MRTTLRKYTIETLGILKQPKAGIHIINAHYMNPNCDTDNGERFIKQLNQIKKYGELIRFEKAVILINNKEIVNEPLIAFSFDDGFLDNYTTIAPILESFNTNAAFFINPNFIECSVEYYDKFSKRVTVNGKKAMNWEQIKDLHSRGHIIGAHTMDHLNIGNPHLSDAELYEQIVYCKNFIENKVGNNCNSFAFPYGTYRDLNARSLELIIDHYDYIFSATDYKNYFSFNNQVINRRHIEPFWPVSHMNYFLSTNKKYS